MEEVTAEQDELLTIVSNGQRGRMEDQRCTLTPITKTRQVHANNSDPDELFQLLVKSQCQRLDEQRVAHSSMPGMEAFTIRDQKDGNMLKTNFDQICNIVSKAQSFRKNSKGSLNPEASGSIRRASFSPQALADAEVYSTLPARSASFNPISDKNNMDYENVQREQDQLLCLVSQAQRGRIEEQRCSINPFAPGHSDNTQSDQEVEKFFKLIANTQNRRLDDQRATLNILPVVQTPTGMTTQESDQLFNMVSRLQGSRIDDQRCAAPNIQLGSPAPPKKSLSQPISPNKPSSGSGSPSKSSRRSGSFSPASEVQNAIDQDHFFSLVHHAQQNRLDDQRCSFVPYIKPSSSPSNPVANPRVDDREQFFNLLANFQSKGLDDQRVALSALPGIQASHVGSRTERNRSPTPQIVLTPASPAAPKKVSPSPSSPSLSVCEADRPPPRSATFCPVADSDRLLYDDPNAQISFQISMRFPPHQTHDANNQPYVYPEVFLTIGQAGEAMVLPLSPRPGRPMSLSVNPPRNHRSRSSSPNRSPGRQGRSRPSSPHPGDTVNLIGPYEDYFSLIQRVHGAQLQQADGRDRATEAKESKETRKGKGKSSAKKEKKEGSKDKKK